MIVQLQPDQISGFWEAIRHATIQVNRIPKELQQDYAIKVLERLLSGMLQCWVGYTIDEKDMRHVHVIYTTSIQGDSTHGFNVLSMETVYGFRRIPMELYEEGISKLVEFAKTVGCKAVMGQSNNKRAQEVMLANGFEQHHIVYTLNI